jgi:hypothetical protein
MFPEGGDRRTSAAAVAEDNTKYLEKGLKAQAVGLRLI